jgi:hypothetical protein
MGDAEVTVTVEAVQSEYDQWLERVQATFESVAFCCWHRLGDRAAAAEVSTQVVARLVGNPSIFKYFGLPYSGRIARLAERGIDEARNGRLTTSAGWDSLAAQLLSVPPEHREVLVLGCIDDQDDPELAETLGCDVETATNRKAESLQYWQQLAAAVLQPSTEP